MAEDNLQGGNLPAGPSEDPTQGAAKAPQAPDDLTIPKWRFDQVTQAYKASEAKIADLTNQLAAAKSKDDEIAQLKKQLADQQAAFDLEKKNTRKTSAVEAAIKDKTVDADVVKKLIDMDKLTFNDKDELEGLEDQIKELQKTKPYLWNKASSTVQKGGVLNTKPADSFAKQLAKKRASQLESTTKAKNYFS